MAVCLLPICSVACETINVTRTSAGYDPSFVISGDIEHSVKYTFNMDENVNRVSLFEVLTKVQTIGKIENILILTHSQKSVLINEACISEYYLTVSKSGVVSVDTDIEIHKNIGSYPLVSISEISIFTDVKSGINHVYENKSYNVDYITFLKAHGILIKNRDAVANGIYEISTFNYNGISVKNLLPNKDYSIILRFDDNSSFEINYESQHLLRWTNGKLYLASGSYKNSDLEIYKHALVEIDYRIN